MTLRVAAILALIVAASAQAQTPPITRTTLQSIEAPASARSVQSFLVVVAPHATIARHTHPGVEVGYLVTGMATVSVAGQPDRAIAAGGSWAFQAGAPHSFVNTGDTPAELVVTYVVEAAKPLATPAP